MRHQHPHDSAGDLTAGVLPLQRDSTVTLDRILETTLESPSTVCAEGKVGFCTENGISEVEEEARCWLETIGLHFQPLQVDISIIMR